MPTVVFWLAMTLVIVGEIGSRGWRMSLVTAQADFAISHNSHGKYVSALHARCTGCPSASAVRKRAATHHAQDRRASASSQKKRCVVS